MSDSLHHDLHAMLNDLQVFHLELDKFILALHGLRRTRFYILRNVYHNPEISISHLSNISLTDVASTSRIVRSLEKEGLVNRSSKEGDRRTFYISLTADGAKLYEQANADLQASLKDRFEKMDSEQLAHFLQILTTLRDNFREHYESLLPDDE